MGNRYIPGKEEQFEILKILMNRRDVAEIHLWMLRRA